ncbi:MAG: hypothetical protein ATN34_04590 [Epulopiscium sp. Nele67-Bin002]|nr:MAG: hypothetical protein BEN18_00470 [Epulopiscium sp. Nuni2H_MBin001]OON90748.1 MAG: hypothetical protein ATN33_02355 [Epulopiscium sp. Nele67-Bin001]OON90763.1 MAG: hypothetical protein ATN34_04590 [Epulopiscium sp. Nele67-Bin002]
MPIGSISSMAQMADFTGLTTTSYTTSAENFEDTLKQAMNSSEDEELREACEEMESYLLSMIYKQMKNSVLTENSLIPKGDYEEMFDDFLVDSQVSEMVKSGGVGLADMMYKQLSLTAVQVNSEQTLNQVDAIL